MSIFIPATLTRTLPLGTFDAVRQLLWQMAELPGTLILGEEAIATAEIAAHLPPRFVVFVSKQFSALLWAKEEQRATEELPALPILLNVGLTFAPDAIASFGWQLYNIYTAAQPQIPVPIDIHILKRETEILKSNDANMQSEFTLQLLEILGREPSVNSRVSLEKTVEDFCNPQLKQERLLHQVTTQIRQSLELPVILSTAVKELQKFLQVDRFLIYQVEHIQKQIGNSEHQSHFLTDHKQESQKILGRVTYEALKNKTITSVLKLTEGSICFPDVPNYQDKYRKGITKCINDIEITYGSHSCFFRVFALVSSTS
jgi:two-component system sensor histidine kinase/response regulator